MNPPPPCSRILRFSEFTVSAFPFKSALWRMTGTEGVALEVENLEDEYRPSVFLQNLELKKSAPGSRQHFILRESVLVILPVDKARSYEISSSANSRPCTRVSKERIPFCELPMNL